MITGSPEAMKDSKKAIAYLNAAKNGLRNDTAKAISLLLISTGTRLPSTFILFAYQFTQKPGNCQPVTLWTVEKNGCIANRFFEEVGGLYGLSRGLEKSKAKHMPVRDFGEGQPADAAPVAAGLRQGCCRGQGCQRWSILLPRHRPPKPWPRCTSPHVSEHRQRSVSRAKQNAKARELKGAIGAGSAARGEPATSETGRVREASTGGRSCSGSTGNVFDPCSWLTLGNATATVTKSKPRKVRGFGECALLGGDALTRLLND